MQRIKLTKIEKEVFFILTEEEHCPPTYSPQLFTIGVQGLENHGLAFGMWASGHILVAARLTPEGEAYLSLNPKLRNPIDWKWIITTVISVIAAIASIIALFVACKVV